MSSPSRLRLLYLSYLSKPASDRPIYREIRRLKPRKIVELGIGAAQRSLRMIEVASHFHEPREIEYTGMDLFEGRTECDGPGISLKTAHRLLKATGARIRLVPGVPCDGLTQTANALGKVDILVLAPRPDAQRLARAWFYVPRLLHDESLVFLESVAADGKTSLRVLDRGEIELLAGALQRRAA